MAKLLTVYEETVTVKMGQSDEKEYRDKLPDLLVVLVMMEMETYVSLIAFHACIW